MCYFMFRYNIFIVDYDGWNIIYNINVNVKLAVKVGLFQNEADNRGFVLENNFEVKVFFDVNFDFELVVNIVQYGRIFEDR